MKSQEQRLLLKEALEEQLNENASKLEIAACLQSMQEWTQNPDCHQSYPLRWSISCELKNTIKWLLSIGAQKELLPLEDKRALKVLGF